MASPKPNYAYTTLITRSSYLAGVIVLAYTLKKYNAQYPLVVLYTSTLPASSISALEAEAPRTNLILRRVSALLPRADIPINLIAERFGDTWTKLRVFELWQYDTVCYLDADMILRKNMDAVFEVRLPGDDWIAANHACVCNKDKDAWAPEEWNEENCAYSLVKHPEALTEPMPVRETSRPTHHLLNSGMFLFRPSEGLWERMMEYFNTSEKLGEFKFPDQDFLAEFFRGRWVSVGWQFNALKTMKYWHPEMWRDEEVVCLHYIVDKPWAKRVGEDGVAGYLGRDGETHKWWWQEYEDWVRERMDQGEDELVKRVGHYVAGGEGQDSEDMRAIGSQVQAFANNKPKAKDNPKEEKEDGKANGRPSENAEQSQGDHQEEPQQGPHGLILRKKMLGERGHGPVVRGGHGDLVHPRGRSMMDP